MKKLMLLGFSALFLISCGVGLEDSSGPDVDRELKNQKLRAEYESVRGKYAGCIRLSQSEKCFPVSMYIWTGEVQEAPRPGDLKPGVRVVLRGRLMQTQFIGDSDNLIMTGQYDAITGRILLDPDVEISKTSTGCRLGGQDPITISANVSGGNVTGSILRNGQEWAKIENMRRESLDVSTGSVLSEEQEYRRLQSTYEPVVGMYDGKLTRNVCGKNRDENFQLWIYIERVAQGPGGGENATAATCYVPRLTVRTLREYAGELSDVNYVSITRFDPEFFLPQFSSATSKLTLDLIDGRLKGEIHTSGRWGGFDLKRTSKQVVAPEDETTLIRERLERTFARFTGNYRGTNKALEGPDWPVSLQLYVDEGTVDGVRRPFLLALYKRPDFDDDSIGSRLMDVSVEIDGCKPLLAMKSEPNQNIKIPGVGLMKYNATYDEATKSMTGDLVDHRGPQGELTVKKK